MALDDRRWQVVGAPKLVVNQRFARDAVGDSCISKYEQQLGTTRLEQASSDASFTLICH